MAEIQRIGVAARRESRKPLRQAMKKRPLLLLSCAALAAYGQTGALLVNRVDQTKKAVGIVVATVDPNGRSWTAYGSMAKDRTQTPDDNTLFEIGSITKVFTSLILADMVERGELTLDTPVQSLLPDTVKIPSGNGKQITLLDLSMQVSGLPRMPNNFRPADFNNPYADYDPSRLYEFLSGYTLTRDIGEKYEYSNLGVGLLGHALARKAGMSYEALVRARVLDPLGMKDTTITLSAEQKKRLATGHNAALQPVKNWDLNSLAGAGALRSTANDMLKFLAANLELTDSPLKPAMRRMRSQRRPTGTPGMDIMMAWHTLALGGSEMIWHNGGTGGYRSFAGFELAKRTGVVVLCNTSFDIDDIGRHILNPQFPAAMLSAPKQRTELSLDAKTLADYAGDYVLTPAFTIQIAAEGNHLFAQATGQPRFEIFAEKRDEFFLRVVDAQISFVRDGAGKVNALVLHQNGMDQKGSRKP
jgi:CubicO group peptidase (beta-lactamase class C family)